LETSANKLKSTYDAIYLAPHLDDAALSCGGQIYQQTAVGQSVLIVTVMAGDPPPGQISAFSQLLHERWQLTDVTAVVQSRRAEDVRACQLLGADYVHWQIPDAIYRADPSSGVFFYAGGNNDIMGAVHPAETGLITRLARRLAALPAAARLVAPLAVGNHVDHQITQRAAAAAWGTAVRYYEDYPYAARDEALANRLAGPEQWQNQVIPLTEAALQVKFNAVAAFTSQLSTFFSGRADLEAQIRAYTEKVGGERLWYPEGPLAPVGE
jgi:LmbE family N-acetylglucosaminyl deacetylase